MENDEGRTYLTLATLLEGFYERVAGQLGVDAGSVFAVARGEAHSKSITEAIKRELQAVVKKARAQEGKPDPDEGTGRRGPVRGRKRRARASKRRRPPRASSRRRQSLL